MKGYANQDCVIMHRFTCGCVSAQLSLNEISQLVKKARIDQQLGIDPVKFELAREEGMKAAQKKLIKRSNSDSVLELQCPVDLLENYKPYWCRGREWILANYITLLVIFLSVFLVVKFIARAYQKQKVSKRAEQLYLQVCEALEEKAHHKSSGKETWVVASHLRDHLLTPRERQSNAAWLMVEQTVYRDSRIDQYPKLVKGESKVVWEWQVEGVLRSPTPKTIK